MSAALKQPAAAPRISPAIRVALARRARKELAKRSLHEFLRQSWATMEPGVEFEDNWHIYAFCLHVQSMLEGWLVANGHGSKWMHESVRKSWEMNGLEFQPKKLLVQNLVLNLPPITLKSKILMVVAPAWMWLHCPSFTLTAISTVDDNVKRDSNAHRELVESDWYRETFLRKEDGTLAWTIKRKQDSVAQWANTENGERKSKTLQSSWTGVHTDGQFIDDPEDAHVVHSERMRKDGHFRYSTAIKNRVKHGDRSIRICIQQRVHLDDWTNAQVSKGIWSPTDRKAWAWVVMPLEYGCADERAPEISPWGWFDPRSVANDNMQPSRFSEEFIADERRDKGEEGFQAQYNQRPAALDMGMIKRADVRFFRCEEDAPATVRPHGCGLRTEPGLEGQWVPPITLTRDLDTGDLQVDWCTLSIDASNGSEALTASNVGIVMIAGRGMERFILDDRSAVMGIDRMYEEIEQTLNDYPECGTLLVELKAAGSSVIARINNSILEGRIVDRNGVPRVVVVEAYNPKQDSKQARAAAMQPSWRQGLVYVRDGKPWLFPKIVAGGRSIDDGFVTEITAFPRGKRDDRVDCVSQCVAFYQDSGNPMARWTARSRTSW